MSARSPIEIRPPRSLEELVQRAARLAGRALDELADELTHELADAPLGASERAVARASEALTHRKGKRGQLVERALGASAGSRSAPDFVQLGVELKTIPVDDQGKPIESTFVSSLSVADAEMADWESSGVRAKLQHVLFVPIVHVDGRPAIIGAPLFWRPSAEQESILRADFDDLVGLIALGQIEAVTARLGRWLQIRPKAAHGRVRTRAYGPDGEYLETIPRGFYLRARFTGALLRNPTTLEP